MNSGDNVEINFIFPFIFPPIKFYNIGLSFQMDIVPLAFPSSFIVTDYIEHTEESLRAFSDSIGFENK